MRADLTTNLEREIWRRVRELEIDMSLLPPCAAKDEGLHKLSEAMDLFLIAAKGEAQT